MKRTLVAGIFTLLGGAAALLLAASIFYSCRTGGNPHHSGTASAQDAPVEAVTPASSTAPATTQRSAAAPSQHSTRRVR